MNLETVDKTALNKELSEYQKFIEELENEISTLTSQKNSLIQKEVIYVNAENNELSGNARAAIQNSLNEIKKNVNEIILQIEKQRERLRTAQEVHKTLLKLL